MSKNNSPYESMKDAFVKGYQTPLINNRNFNPNPYGAWVEWLVLRPMGVLYGIKLVCDHLIKKF